MSSEHKIHLVARDTVAQPMGMGALDIRPMRELNFASMAKLGWRLLNEHDPS